MPKNKRKKKSKRKSNLTLMIFPICKSKDTVFLSKLKSNDNIGFSYRLDKTDDINAALKKINSIYLFDKMELTTKDLSFVNIDIPNSSKITESQEYILYCVLDISEENLKKLKVLYSEYSSAVEFYREISFDEYMKEVSEGTGIIDKKYSLELSSYLNGDFNIFNSVNSIESNEFDLDDMDFDEEIEGAADDNTTI